MARDPGVPRIGDRIAATHGLRDVTVSIRRMKLGEGFRYLLETVARGDGAVAASTPLTRYYAESGTPPGYFAGAGLAGVDGGRGVAEGGVCSEAMLFNMLGQCADPVTGAPLGRPARPGSVAGFDLTFSVPKSISAAWAVADRATQAVIYEAHREAIRRTIAYAERQVFFSRSGAAGIVQEEVRGVLAACFDHWDSRAGDPQLHTHVVVQNRARSLSDGKWRTLDSRALYRQVVTLSELHQGVLQDLLTARLGWAWDPRRRRHSPAPKWEAVGVSDALIAEFSQRAREIDRKKDEAIAAFIAAHGRAPTAVEVVRLRQVVTLQTRKPKEYRSLAEQTASWRERARRYLGPDSVAWVATLRERNDLPLLRAGDLQPAMLADLARSVTEAVTERRTTFSRANLLAEIHRQLHGVRFATPDDRITVAEHTADLAINGETVRLTAPQLHHVPERFRRPDGTSKFRGIDAGLFTTPQLLDAEARLLDAGRATDGPRLDPAVLAAVTDANLPGGDHALTTDQAVVAEQIATSGRVLDVLVGPAGTGKSTSLAGLRAAWERAHGPGSVIGLAPSAAAAEVLARELGIGCENTAKWLAEHRRRADRNAWITALRRRLAQLDGAGPATPARTAARHILRRRLHSALAEDRDGQFHTGQLVIIDEASLAGTLTLDELVSAARHAGAKVLIAGDWAQLSAIDAGGAFGLLARDRDHVPELAEVRRFTHRWEKRASLHLRIGDTRAIDAYRSHDRIDAGDRDTVLDALYAAWKHDSNTGLVSLMIAADRDTVTELNRRARADRITAGQVTEAGVPIAGDQLAGVGDRVITRLNDRTLAIGRRWVKNGDQWLVAVAHRDGRLTVRRTHGGGTLTLPADYVRKHVELGYATTAHRAQGRTVDTAHSLVTASTTREVLYVAATRGRDMNRLYVDTSHDPDHDTSHGPLPTISAEEILARVLANTGADQSAHAVLRREQDAAESIAVLAREYATLARHAQTERWTAVLTHAGLTAEQLAQVTDSDAHGPLLAALRTAETRGLNVEAALPTLVQSRPLHDADDLAAVLHDRVTRWASTTATRPARDRSIVGLLARADHVTDPDLDRALTDRAQAIERRALHLVADALHRHERWITALGEPPTGRAQLTAWVRAACTVAAYREVHDIHGPVPVAIPQHVSSTVTADARAADAAWQRARRLAEQAKCQTAAAPSSTTHLAPQAERGIEQ